MNRKRSVEKQISSEMDRYFMASSIVYGVLLLYQECFLTEAQNVL